MYFDSPYYIRFIGKKRWDAWSLSNDNYYVKNKIDCLAQRHTKAIRTAQQLIRDLEGGYLPIV